MELTLSRSYVEERNGGLYLAGKRVSLDSIVYGYRRGESPEEIAESFPALTLEEVYGAIAFYLANHGEVDAYLKDQEARYEDLRAASLEQNQDLTLRMGARLAERYRTLR